METLLLTRNDVESLLSIEECIAGVEQAFRLWTLGKAQAPGILGVHAKDGGFHMKAGILNLGKEYFVAKTNANFPQNMKRHGLPTIQGVIMVSDATNGRLLALMDSIEITIIRTGAATAVAAKYLSKNYAKSVTICGCGNQGIISLKALKAVRNVRQVFAYDIDRGVTEKFVTNLQRELNIQIEVVSNLKSAIQESDIVVTCTPSKSFFISKEDVRPGTFIAAVGSDNEDKQELDPFLLANSKVVADSIDQAIKIGELHHAVDKGVMNRQSIYGELGEVVVGIKRGRETKEEIVIFDSTGIGLQDVAAAAIVYQKAIDINVGRVFSFD